MVIAVITFFVNLLKLRYHGARPFWSADAVQAFHCTTQYGNPSGHAMTAFCAGLLFAFSQEKKVKAGAIGLALVFGSVVAYSRLFLGVHSLNQVLFGGLIGVWIALTID